MLQNIPSVKKKILIIGSEWNSVSARLPCYFSKGLFEEDFLDTYLTTSLWIRYFQNTSVMSIIFFFWKCWKFNLNFENAKKTLQIIFPFWDNCIWKYCYKFSPLRTKYFLSAINGLTKRPNIWHITKGIFFNLNCFHRDQ